MYCYYDTQCASGVCKDRTCIGKKLGEDCVMKEQGQDAGDCDPGMYCANGKCATLLEPEAQCTLDTQCQASFGCINKKCTAYFLLEDGAETTSSLYCKS